MLDKNNSYRLLLLTLLLLMAYSVCRLLFWGFNYIHFSDLKFIDFLKISWGGLRFDLSAIVLTNSLFIILYTWPSYLREKQSYRTILKWLFVSVNSIALFSNCVDLAYFQFTLKRTNASVFHFLGGNIGNDLFQLIPVFLKDYWYIFIIWAFFITAISHSYERIDYVRSSPWRFTDYIRQFFVFIITIGLGIVAYRGGFQLKPISIITAGEYTSSKYIPLIINTPFSIIKTSDINHIEPSKDWYITDKDLLNKIYSTYNPAKNGEIKKLNVCVIILESFSKEYIGKLNGTKKGYTPFLDSLIDNSISFNNAFANGKSSIDGIPAITAGIPTWMNEPFITSPYSTNQINSLASLLNKKGYYSAFFHGGSNGTMGFEAFSKIAGYNNYFGRNEYNNEKDFDGNWGIWDEPYLQYAANTINTFKEPFLATIFTLSSHHPYSIPHIYQKRFKGGSLPIHKCIEYTDYALKKFFNTAKQMNWYKNTIFVLCADHTGVSEIPFYTNKIGNYAIPIIYFTPFDSVSKIDSTITQQIDIMPSILDYLNYPYPYFSFGNSVFDSTYNEKRFAMTFNSGMYNLINNNYVLQFDGNKSIDLFNYKKDSMLINNILHQEKKIGNKMEAKAKAIIQTYQQSLINNNMFYH
jgi:phosphoglycerol transferase MdoB-like AlkP superfamily enzyme